MSRGRTTTPEAPRAPRPIRTAALVLLLLCPAVALNVGVRDARAQPAEVLVIIDENDLDGAPYREASSGAFTPPDSLRLEAGTHLPVIYDRAFSGSSSGVLEYAHGDGSWDMDVAPTGGGASVEGFDSLVVYLNGPVAVPGRELPRVRLVDGSGETTGSAWMSAVSDVRVAASAFTEPSETDVEIQAEYVGVRPPDERRSGYPENLTIRFSDVVVDTSVAGIGVPEAPARFTIETESGIRPDFRFLDLDDDGTLSGADEYVEIRFAAYDGSPQSYTSWRLRPTAEPLDPPGEGDVYRLELAFDEFSLDGDPDTWQRIAVPLDVLFADGAFDPSDFAAVAFEHGGRTDGLRTLWIDRLTLEKNDDEPFLEMVQRRTFEYFREEMNPANGLVRDRSDPDDPARMSPASIAAMGFGYSALTVGVDRGWMPREEARDRILAAFRFLWSAEQSEAEDATGYRGFFYHFLDMETGRRAWESELSTIDTALLLAGVLDAGMYFDADHPDEAEIRALADSIYHRVDFGWMQHRGTSNSAALTHGWYPDPAGRNNADPATGFIVNDWIGYNEAMILYILALGSPTHPASDGAWEAWTSGYDDQWRNEYGYTFLTFPPLFGHQYSHVWIDFRGLQDAYMREKGIDYFENSRRATLAQRAYHVANPQNYPNYGRNEWGLTASDTPDGYRARGAPPPQNDDGTLVPTAPGGSIAFTPEESIAALRTMYDTYQDRLWGPYGFRDAYNAARDWVATDYIGIDQGPILLMIENHRTEAIWDRMMRHPAVQRGLERAGFAARHLATEPEPSPPGERRRLAVYPNPSAGAATLTYAVDAAGPVEISVVDVLGRRVAILASEFAPAGTRRLEADLSRLPSGTYFVVVETAGGQTAVPLSIAR